MTWSQRIWLAAILLLAAALRLTGVAWDGYEHHHPDERYISWVATTIEFPALSGVVDGTALDPATSTFNPFRWPPEASSEGIVVVQDAPRAFAYGHVPLYMGVAATRIMERVSGEWTEQIPEQLTLARDLFNSPNRIEFHHLTAVSRALTGLVDTLTVLLVFLIGRHLFGVRVGLVAAGLLAVTVMHIQLAHFFISDPYLTFFVTLALYFMLLATERGRWSALYLALAAVAVGLAVGSKFSAVLLLLPLSLVAWMSSANLDRRALALAGVLAAAVLAFGMTNPFALLDTSCEVELPPVQLGGATVAQPAIHSCYLDNILIQNRMVSGETSLPFTQQYQDTLPYLYFLEMQLRWGMGPFLGLLSLAGVLWAGWRVVAGLRKRGVEDETALARATTAWSGTETQGLIILLLWLVPYFLLTGSFYVKFMRYMQPILPLMILLGAAMVFRIASRGVRATVLAIVAVPTALYAAGFAGIYQQPHPWNAASDWIYDNIRPGVLILSEQWDDALPVPAVAGEGGVLRSGYRNEELSWLSGSGSRDDAAKLERNAALLAEAHYLTVVSQRVYGVVPRLPDQYPLSSAYHQLLFDGELGYELVWVGGRFPSLAGVSLSPDLFGWPGLQPPADVAAYLDEVASLQLGRVDESFTVYDQPLTMIFRNTGRLPADEIAGRILAAGPGAGD